MKHTVRMQEIITGACRIAAGRAGTSVPPKGAAGFRHDRERDCGSFRGRAQLLEMGRSPPRGDICHREKAHTGANARRLKPGGI